MDEQLFPQQPAPRAAMPAGPTMVPLGAQITSLATRLKLVEERYANLAKRNQITETSLLSFERDSKTELRVLSKQLSDMRKRISEINSKLDAISGELGTVVRKHEFNTVERYIDMWQPMDFLSRDEAMRLIREAAADRGVKDNAPDNTSDNNSTKNTSAKRGGA